MENPEFYRQCLIRLNNGIGELVTNHVQRALNFKPAAIEKYHTDISELTAIVAGKPKFINKKYHPLLKLAVDFSRMQAARRISERTSKTGNKEVIESIEKELIPYTEIENHEWYKNTESMRIPVITDFLTIEYAENLNTVALANRVYDEKFHILQAPHLFVKDLAYYRYQCNMRSTPVCVAYFDIDDFKTFNTKYSETVVDRVILPVFMRILEAHSYSKGWCYRYGGDEYVSILPNCTIEEAKQSLSKLQEKLSNITYAGVPSEENPKLSIGVFEVNPGCSLTEQEIEEEACNLKAKAKDNGKNRIEIN